MCEVVERVYNRDGRTLDNCARSLADTTTVFDMSLATGVSKMTYNVSSGTLNPTMPYHTILLAICDNHVSILRCFWDITTRSGP